MRSATQIHNEANRERRAEAGQHRPAVNNTTHRRRSLGTLFGGFGAGRGSVDELAAKEASEIAVAAVAAPRSQRRRSSASLGRFTNWLAGEGEGGAGASSSPSHRPRRISSMEDKIERSTKTAKRAERRERSRRTYSVEQLASEAAALWDAAELCKEDAEKTCPEGAVPAYMDEFNRFGLGAGLSELDEAQFQTWRKRCEDWLAASKLMHAHSLKPSDTSLDFEGVRTHMRLPDVLVPILLRCPHLSEVSIRNSRLSNTALMQLAQQLGARLQRLDLTGTRDFDDQGVKGIAAFCHELRSLKLSECTVSDDGIAAIGKHCLNLTLLDVTESEAVTDVSLGALPADCAVEKHAPLEPEQRNTRTTVIAPNDEDEEMEEAEEEVQQAPKFVDPEPEVSVGCCGCFGGSSRVGPAAPA